MAHFLATKGKDHMDPHYDDGILAGWYGEAILNGKQTHVFIPRREEDVEADRRRAKWWRPLASSLTCDCPTCRNPAKRTR